MDGYMNLMKSWYQSGQEIMGASGDNGKNKAAFVKIEKSSTMYDARCFH